MKKVCLLMLGAGLLAACSSAPKQVGINAVPEAVTSAIVYAERSCNTDADSVAVQKGCCPCAGYATVNKEAGEKIEKIWNKECKNAPCTREMCYVQVVPVCENNLCVGRAK